MLAGGLRFRLSSTVGALTFPPLLSRVPLSWGAVGCLFARSSGAPSARLLTRGCGCISLCVWVWGLSVFFMYGILGIVR